MENAATGVALRDVTGENFAALINLQLPEDQQDMLASNAYSIAESKFDPYARPRARPGAARQYPGTAFSPSTSL